MFSSSEENGGSGTVRQGRVSSVHLSLQVWDVGIATKAQNTSVFILTPERNYCFNIREIQMTLNVTVRCYFSRARNMSN